MVSKKQAFQASAVSGLVIGLIHWAAHSYFGANEQAVVYVGATVVFSTFAIAYYGMVRN